MPPNDYLTFADQLADAAREVVLRWHAQPLVHERKSDDSPVTRADREAEQVMRDGITRHYPDHGIHGEEFGVERPEAEHVWVLDPIDGTKAFITGRPLFGTLIALLQHGRPVVGVADMPALGQRYAAMAGGESRRDGVVLASSSCTTLADARMAATSVDMFVGDDRGRFESLADEVWFTSWGGDLYIYLMVAAGRLDLVVEAQLAPYDVMALVPVVEGAGGVISDWQGKPLSLASDGHVVAAANAALHEQALARLA